MQSARLYNTLGHFCQFRDDYAALHCSQQISTSHISILDNNTLNELDMDNTHREIDGSLPENEPGLDHEAPLRLGQCAKVHTQMNDMKMYLDSVMSVQSSVVLEPCIDAPSIITPPDNNSEPFTRNSPQVWKEIL